MTDCSIDGCESPVSRRGWCVKHYQRWYTTGDPLTTRTNRVVPVLAGLDAEEILMRNHTKDPESGCWRWQGAHDRKGYGHWRHHRVHRLAHQLWVGPIPDGFHVDHVLTRGCVHKDCLNPAHLEAVTAGENNRRSPGTISTVMAAKTHCIRGHEFTEENTYWHRDKRSPGALYRKCRACYREKYGSPRFDELSVERARRRQRPEEG